MRRYTLIPLLAALVFAASVAALTLVSITGKAEAASTGATGATSTASTAGGITGVRFGDHVDYERAVLDFEASPSGEPPKFSWKYRDGDTVIRVRLPETTKTFKSGGLALGQAISNYRVVERNGGMYVDLHLDGAARSVTVFSLDDPGRIVVDVAPGGDSLFAKPARANGVYVMSPRPGSAVGSGNTESTESMKVRGYGRPFEASGVWRIKDSNGEIVSRGTYTTEAWASAWGAYSFRADYPDSLSGERGTLEVGSLSARDGSFSGATVPLRFK